MMREVTPWVWFDVDDVLVESTPLFQESMDRWTGTTMPWQNWTHNRFHQFYGVDDDDVQKIAEMKQRWKDDRVLENSPLMAGVAEAMAMITAAGAKIGLLTARAWHSEGEAITRDMALQHRLPVETVISMDYDQTKADFLTHTGQPVIGFIDDTPRHVEGCIAAGFHAVLMSQPWNTEAIHLPRVKSLGEFAQQVRQHLQPEVVIEPVQPRRFRRR